MAHTLLKWMSSEDNLVNFEHRDHLIIKHNITSKIGNPLQIKILDVMISNSGFDFTINEVGHILGLQNSTISPRMNDLRSIGVIIFSKKRTSRVTNKTNNAYKLINNFM